MEAYLRSMNEDDDKDVVAQVCSSLVDVLKSVPFEALQQCKSPQAIHVVPYCFIKMVFCMLSLLNSLSL